MGKVINLETDFEPYNEEHYNYVNYTCNRWLFRFKNGKGLSVKSYVLPDGSILTYGDEDKPFEAALIKFEDAKWSRYTLIDEPVGYLNSRDVNDLLNKLKMEWNDDE